MAIDNSVSFKKMLNDEKNEDLKFKAQEIAASYIAEAAQRGINMTLDDCYALSTVRLHVLTGERINDNWMDEAEGTLETFQKAAEERAVMEAVADAKSDRHEEARKALEGELAKLSPSERMARARELGQRLPGPKTGEQKAPMTPDEKARALAEMERLPASMKMARYREVFG